MFGLWPAKQSALNGYADDIRALITPILQAAVKDAVEQLVEKNQAILAPLTKLAEDKLRAELTSVMDCLRNTPERLEYTSNNIYDASQSISATAELLREVIEERLKASDVKMRIHGKKRNRTRP